MPTIDDLLKAFINAGFDTPEKISSLISQLATQAKLKQIDLQLDGLSTKQNEVLAPIQNERVELQNQRAAIIAELGQP